LDDAVARTIIEDATTGGTDSFAHGSNWGLATGAAIHGVKDADRGISTYSVDGGPAQSVDDYSSARLRDRTVAGRAMARRRGRERPTSQIS